MAITKKPKASASIDIDGLISKGGGVPRLVPNPEQRQVYVQLRLSEDVLKRIDQKVKSRSVKTPRHTWLLEAIHEKLASEE